MVTAVPQAIRENEFRVTALENMRNEARQNYFSHCYPGGFTAAEMEAWSLEHSALLLRLQAAQIRLTAELELQTLLSAEHYNA
jgi:hypothetical protein